METGRNPNASKLIWLPLLPANMMKIHLKIKALECSQHFSHYTCMFMFFSRRSRAANSAVPGWISLNFEHVLDITAVRVTCKN